MPSAATPNKIFTITSLSHSGSTVFSMALACHQQLVSVGEVFQILRDDPNKWLHDAAHNCSCGKHASECEFWGPVLRSLKALPRTDDKYAHIPKAYEIVADQFSAIFGKEKYMVDTSKGLHHIRAIEKTANLMNEAILLMRDVRAYACSQTRLTSKQNRKGLKKIKTHYWFQILKWYFGNRKRQKLLNELNIDYKSVGYDQFCFNIDKTLAAIYAKADLTEHAQCDSLAQSQHHVLFGNPMRLSTEAHAEIRYDNRWMVERGYLLPLVLFPFVGRYNSKNVYDS